MKRYELAILIDDQVHIGETDDLERALRWKLETDGKGSVWDRQDKRFIKAETRA